MPTKQRNAKCQREDSARQQNSSQTTQGRVLITFVGSNDPYSTRVGGSERVDGPILSLVKNYKEFQDVPLKVFLLVTESQDYLERANELKRLLEELRPEINAEVIATGIVDPIDHAEIIVFLRDFLNKRKLELLSEELYASVTSGTPAMHACLLLLAASKEFPARVLQIRQPKYSSTSPTPLIHETKLQEIPEAPRIKFSVLPANTTTRPEWKKLADELEIIGDDEKLKAILEEAYALASKSAMMDPAPSFLITGETGTGKEKLAQFIHAASGRKGKFVPANCAVIPKNTFEGYIFGWKKGAFTGANGDNKGLILQADGGTLFLDEIGDMPQPIQAAFLRVLQDNMVVPLPGDHDHAKKVNFLLICATNVNLREMVETGEFRTDLYYRINAQPFHLPPLRDRAADIPAIARFVIRKSNIPMEIDAEAMQKLMDFPWPGNIRELTQVLTRAIQRACAKGREKITTEDICLDGCANSAPTRSSHEEQFSPPPFEPGKSTLPSYAERVSDQILKHYLAKNGGNIRHTAKVLGITPQAIYKRLNQKLS